MDIKQEYQKAINPQTFGEFLDGGGALANRAELAAASGYDWHARKLRFEEHFRGQVLMQATAYRSTRDQQWAAENDLLFAANGAAVNISVSGLAQANKNRPLAPYVEMLQQVLATVSALPHRNLRALDKQTWQGIVDLLQNVTLFDATVIDLPPKLRDAVPALSGSETDAALKMQLRLDGQSGAIKHFMFTKATGPDSPYLTELLGDLDAQSDELFVFDGGYWKIDTYHAIVDSGNHFVTKRAGRIEPHVVRTLPLPEDPLPNGYIVLEDALVHLGDDRSRLYRCVRIRLSTNEEITLITSMVEAPVAQIGLLYHYRWTIEIVFRWLKQTLQLDHLLSHDPVGILRQILVALIVWGLLVIANQDDAKLSPKALWRKLMAAIHQAIFDFGFRQGLEHT